MCACAAAMGGLTAQQFCLKWNQHHGSLVSVFEELRSREAFVDVTLVCEGISLKAHKLVLSACSPFFEALFADNPCAHPVVIMSHTREADLRTLLEFMYRGEVNVAQEQLPALLRAAELFQVRGLAEVAGAEGSEAEAPLPQPAAPLPSLRGSHHSQPARKKQRTPPPPPQPRQHDEPSLPAQPERVESPEPVKAARPAAKAPSSRRTFDHSYSDDKTNWVPVPALQRQPPLEYQQPLPVPLPPTVPPDSAASGDDGAAPPVCSVCARVFSTKGNLKRHMLMHRPYRHRHQCTLCLKTFSWPGDLRTHMRVAHGQGCHKSSPFLFT